MDTSNRVFGIGNYIYWFDEDGYPVEEYFNPEEYYGKLQQNNFER